MQNADTLLPLTQYSPVWAIFGVVLFVSATAWVGFVFWTTRKKVQKTIANLPTVQPILPDVAALKIKYLGLIGDIEKASLAKQMTNRQTHQKLSILLRFFVFEVSGFRAQVMTLGDIKLSRYPTLAATIQSYYPDEFSVVLRGSPADGINRARGLVESWQ